MWLRAFCCPDHLQISLVIPRAVICGPDTIDAPALFSFFYFPIAFLFCCPISTIYACITYG
jgi:hypothetical protein